MECQVSSGWNIGKFMFDYSDWLVILFLLWRAFCSLSVYVYGVFSSFLAWKLIWLLSISEVSNSVINFCVLNVWTLIRFHYKQTNVSHNYKLLGLPTYYPFSNKLDVRQIKIKQPAILSWILHDLLVTWLL